MTSSYAGAYGHHYYKIEDLRPGMRVRTRRPHEMYPPEWQLDTSSNGAFWVNFQRGRIVPADLLGQEYIVYSTQDVSDTFWGYQTYEDDNGHLVETHHTLLYASLVADILTGRPEQAPRCDCGKDAAGSRDPGPHSYWCSLVRRIP